LEDLTFVEGVTSLSLGQIPNDVCKVQTLTFTNFGSVHGFVCVRAFADQGLEKPLTKPDLVLIEPSHFVLGPKGGRQVVTVRVDPLVVNHSEETSYVASLAILSGPEAARKILAGSASIVGVSRIRPQFNAEDLKKISSNVKVPAVSLTSSTIDDMVGYFDRRSVHLYGQKSEFHVLNYEETLSETRLNCTADAVNLNSVSPAGSVTKAILQPPASKAKMPTINEERERCKTLPPKSSMAPPPRNANMSLSARKVPVLAGAVTAEKPKKAIHLESEKLIFPTAFVGKSVTAKIKIKNPTSKSIVLHARLLPVGGPFHIQESTLELKPRFYKSLVCTFTPTSKGRFEGKVELAAPGEVTMTATLKGATP